MTGTAQGAIRQELIERSFERAAERLGDITPAVFARYYRAYPKARACFEEHGLGKPHELQGEMVAQVVFFIMEWHREFSWTRYAWASTVPHHIETLHIPPAYFIGLSDAVIDTVLDTVPADCAEERECWEALRASSHDLFASAAAG